jgi:hypothetical protein
LLEHKPAMFAHLIGRWGDPFEGLEVRIAFGVIEEAAVARDCGKLFA